jgi:hypothetical protein
MTREQGIAFLKRKIEKVHADTDRSGGYYDYCGDLDYALLQLEQGPDEEKFVEEVLSNV